MDLIKNKVIKDFFLLYTFAVVLFKSILFIGLEINLTHSRYMFIYAAKFVFSLTIYRSVLYCGFITVLISFTFLMKNRQKIWFLFLFNLIISILFIIDIWYLRGYNSMTSVRLLNQVTNLGDLSDSILSLISKKDIVFAIDFPFLLFFILLQKKLYHDIPRNFVAFGVVFGVSLISLITVLPARDMWNEYIGKKNVDEVVSVFDSNVTSPNLSPIGYHIYDIYSYWKDSHPKSLTQKDREDIKAWFDYKRENLPENKFKAMLKGKNLIIMQVESLEKFVINQRIDGQEITPNLNKLLKNSLFFTNYYEQINNGMSSDADLMTNTSVYPIRSGSTFFKYPFTKYNNSLPLLLQEKGYSTSAYYPAKGSFWNWLPAVSSIGFQKCIDSSNYDQSEVIGFGISDGSYLRQIEPMIAKQKQPFYSEIVTLTSHMPFNLPENQRELKMDKNLDKTYLGGYLQSVHYTDKHLGIFLDNLRKDGLLDSTVFVFYGDHEGIHKFYPDDVKNASPAQPWWLDNAKHLPLIIYQSGMPGQEINTIGGQIDLMPTLSYLIGIDEDKISRSAMGRNLLKTNKSFAVMSNRTLIGEKREDKDGEHDIVGLDIADTIIRSNYFIK